ncbi:DELTA-alicitoxin-Pse2b [Acropora cervicornis]|uniref:DELTA-alicitoxin-Pse2b n=1 Tax=Acropora cervicornis TaxID=6130 RepID=A0AAD9R4X9_ACRCE|nr:DELTA-alicitoxin-Pse2b [Acropora cervicornis]
MSRFRHSTLTPLLIILEYNCRSDQFEITVEFLSIKSGASIKQTTFAQSSESYSERDFQIKSCVSLGGPTSVGEVGVKACGNISETERNRVSNMNTQVKLIVLGGTKNTRNALHSQITKELIEKLMNEADE